MFVTGCTNQGLARRNDAVEDVEKILVADLGQGVSHRPANDLVPPDDSYKVELDNAGGGAIVGAFTFCIDPAGRVTNVKPLERTGFANYDRKLEAALSGWAYRPFVSEGKPIEVCSSVVFVYQQS